MLKLYFDIIKDIGFIIIANTSGNYRHSFE